MTRLEFLHVVVGRARANGFEFRRWFTSRLGLPWTSGEAALKLLESNRRYYALIFSHEFAQAFWKPGSEITFQVPQRSYQRSMPDGSIRTVQNRPYLRRSVRLHAWKYHLREMASTEEPLRYLRRYLYAEEGLEIDQMAESDSDNGSSDSDNGSAGPSDKPKPKKPLRGNNSGARQDPRPLPNGLPGFLQRPYPPRSRKPGSAS